MATDTQTSDLLSVCETSRRDRIKPTKRFHITQHELRQLRKLDAGIDELEEQLAAAKARRKAAAADIMEMLDERIPVQGGTFTVADETAKGRRCPKWKALHQAVVGKDEVERIIANTEPSKGRRSIRVVAR